MTITLVSGIEAGAGLTQGSGLSAGAGLSPVVAASYDFTAGMPAGITFTRASTATGFDSSGNLVSFASGVARSPVYDPSSLLNLGFRVEGQLRNKCTNYNANPTDLTGVNPGGDAAFVVSVVDDGAALAAAGLSSVVSGGKAYKLDNSAATIGSFVIFSGFTGNTNPHSASIYARKASGSGEVSLQMSQGTIGKTVVTGAAYARYKLENVTPGGTAAGVAFILAAGNVAYVILNQLEEASFAGPVIVVAGAAATKAADDATVPTSLIGMPGSPSGLAWITSGRTAPGASSGNQIYGQIDDGSNSNRISIYRSNVREIHVRVDAGGANQADMNLGAVADNTDFKLAFVLSVDNFAAQLVGGSPAFDTSGSMPTGLVTKRFMKDQGTGGIWNGTTKRDVTYTRYMPLSQALSLAASL